MAINKNDFVSWHSSGGISKGKIIKIVKDGEVDGIDGDVKVTGTEDSPAALIEIYKNIDDKWQPSGIMVGHKISSVKKINDLKSEINEFDLEDIDAELNAEKEEITNFPNKGDNEKVSLKNSKYPVKFYSYIKDIKDNYPFVWKMGGNEKTTTWNGNKAFAAYERIKDGISDEESWIKARERFFDRFYNNIKNTDGIIAAMKWLGAVAIGESKMKSIINKEKKKVDEKKSNSENNTFIEICEMSEEDLAGRVKIKMSSHLIHSDRNQWNKNGITWLEEYTQENIKSAIGMNYVVSWADEENQIPSGHGEMSYDEDGNVQFDGVVVGTVLDAYITDFNIDGVSKKVMMTEGYINSQRYPLFVKWLREEIKNGKVHGSIEINGKGKSKNIVYLDGNKNPDGSLKIGRVPVVFDFSGLAILSNIEEPADDNSLVFEVNSKQNNLYINNIENKGGDILNMNKVASGKSVEINNLDTYQIENMLLKAFKITIGDITESYDYGYYVCRLYPLNSEFIVEKWQRSMEDKYYKASYSIDSNNVVTIGDIYEVEKGWVPVNNEKPIEINNKGGKLEMEYKEKYETMAKDYEAMKETCAQMQKEMEEKNSQMQEINEALVNANKMMEEVNGKYETMSAQYNEINGKYEAMMTEKMAAEAKAEKDAKVAEINSYFKTEISKNGFDESELNSLKSFIESVDLEGLKKAESELCVKKIKDMAIKSKEDSEINSKTEMFISIKEKDKKVVSDKIPTFFE